MEDYNWKENIERFKIVQKCPKCSKVALRFSEGRLICSNCAFSQNIGNLK
jgi:ribosomal protein S27AE